MRKSPETNQWPSSRLFGGITVVLSLKILLMLTSCSTGKFLNDNSSTYGEAKDSYKTPEAINEQLEVDSLAKTIRVSEWPWKITVPWECRSLEFTVYDPDWYIFFYEYDWGLIKWDYETGEKIMMWKHIIDVSNKPIKEWTYILKVGIPFSYEGYEPTTLATYDYHKPEILTPTNIQNGELMINQDIPWPVKIILMNLTNTTSQEVELNKSFKQWEVINAFQYLNVSEIHNANCVLIVKDWTGRNVFDFKFHKI